MRRSLAALRAVTALRGLALCALSACSSGQAEDTPAPTATHLLPKSVRRLSVAELSVAATRLVGAPVDLAPALPPDARQRDFSRSLTQSVDAVTLKQLDGAARIAGDHFNFADPTLPPCAATTAADNVPCTDLLLTELAARAFRRAPSESELASLRVVFEAGASTGSIRDGVSLAIRALLGSPELLYDTALGADATDGAAASRLSDDELSSQLAWLVSGTLPDIELRRAAEAGELRSGAHRYSQAQRILRRGDAQPLYRRFVEEWLGLHRLGTLAKANSVAQNFADLRGAMLRETEDVIDDVMSQTGGSLQQLFAGGYSIVPAELSQLYGIATPAAGARISLGKLGRVGLLQQASFLSVFAHEDESAPVLRGKAVLERLLCETLPRPQDFGIDLVLPPPDPKATTRERFAEHSTKAACASCHVKIDGIGFSFENFDAVGRLRNVEQDKPIDSSGHLELDDREMMVTDSAALARALAGSADLSKCLARQVVRFAHGGDAPEVEDDFIAGTRGLPSAERDSIAGLVLAYVQSDWFAWRSQ